MEVAADARSATARSCKRCVCVMQGAKLLAFVVLQLVLQGVVLIMLGIAFVLNRNDMQPEMPAGSACERAAYRMAILTCLPEVFAETQPAYYSAA
eukprot:600403-Pelagomonas_calceolata.AAC.1